MGTTRNVKWLGYRTTSRSRAAMMLAVDAAGYLLLWPLTLFRRLRGRGFRLGSCRRIAVFRLDGIGDLVLSGPALSALRAACPDSHITLFVNRWSAGVAELLPGPDAVVPLDAVLFRAFKEDVNAGQILTERRCLRALGRESNYDLVVDLRGDFLSILEAHWLGGRQLVSRGSRAGGFLLSRIVRQPEEGRVSEVDLNLDFVSRLAGRPVAASRPTFRPLPASAFGGAVAELTARTGSEYICFAVAAPYASRMYPAAKWVEVMRRLREQTGLSLVVLGAPGDRELCDSIAADAGDGVFSAAGEMSLLESTACISKARLFVGNDGGLIHIASALQIPLVQLFGPADPVCFGHHGEREIVIRKDCPYNPCPEQHCLAPDNWCMDRIAPDEVVKAALDQLAISG